MKIKLTISSSITDSDGVITEYVKANNVFLGVVVYRPEGYAAAGWAAYSYQSAEDMVGFRNRGDGNDYGFVHSALSAYAAHAIRDHIAAGREHIEPTDEEFYGFTPDYVIAR